MTCPSAASSGNLKNVCVCVCVYVCVALPPKRRRLSHIAPGETGPPSPPNGPDTGHHLLTWGPAEWCSRCGRVSAATAPGRAQQWRRPCHPLPSFVSKRDKGHKLIFTGQWHCLECPCPPDKLYRKTCARTAAVRAAPPVVLVSHRSSYEAPGHTAPGNVSPVPQAQGPAPGIHVDPVPAPGLKVHRPPLQASLTRFFGPAPKRARLGSGDLAHLPQGTARPPG